MRVAKPSKPGACEGFPHPRASAARAVHRNPALRRRERKRADDLESYFMSYLLSSLAHALIPAFRHRSSSLRQAVSGKTMIGVLFDASELRPPMLNTLFQHPILLQAAPQRLLSLSTADLLIIALYFVLVLAIGFYLRRFAGTGEGFFMAGREMTAWIAGLSFLAANLGSLELMDGPRRRTSMESWPPIGTGSAPSRRCFSWASS